MILSRIALAGTLALTLAACGGGDLVPGAMQTDEARALEEAGAMLASPRPGEPEAFETEAFETEAAP